MHVIQVFINEALNEQDMSDLREALMAIPHVAQVVANSRMPHDLLVEYNERHVVPMEIIKHLQQRGLNSNVVSG